MSVPVRAMGMAIAWIGKGVVMPTWSRACTIGAITPRLAKVFEEISALVPAVWA